jgi:uncharacterized membrane protein YebE (DUF533 family)
MFNPTDLLGGLLQGGMGGPGMDRLGHAMGERGLGAPGGPLGQILGRLGGAGGGYPAQAGGYPSAGEGYPSAGGGALGGLAEAVGEALGGGRSAYGGQQPGYGTQPGYGAQPGYQGGGGDILGGLAGLAGRALGGGGYGGGLGGGAMGGLGALAAAVLAGRGGGGYGGGAPAGGGLLGTGALAVLGMLAMRALQGSGQARAAGFADPGQDPAALPGNATSGDTAHLVLRAMIDAAKADGEIDEDERRRIAAKAGEDGDPEAVSFLRQELARPADPAALAAAAPDPVVAAQVYAASLLAIRVDSEAERAYLRDLAGRLGLDPGTVAQLHRELGAPEP